MTEQARSRMSTITDVAREAGVSVATVSRALRGLNRVSADTRARVLRVAAELDYVASPTATSLASGRTQVVGVVAPFLSRWFFASIVSAIEQALRRASHHVLLFDLEDHSDESRLPLSQSMLWKRVDGVITLSLPLDPDEIDLLDRLRLPVVSIGIPVADRPTIRIDDALAMRQATEHLLALGHTRIAYVGAIPDNVAHALTPQTRFDSFARTMTTRGLVIRPDWVLAAQWTADSALEHSLALLAGSQRPTAIVAASDEMAIGALAAAGRLGITVPDELSIIGIDDHSMSSVMGLTTVRQDVQGQGRLAAELLLEALVEGRELDDQRSLFVPTEVVVRRSTGPAAT